MSKIISFAKVIRRNWKKSTVFFGLLAYGASYGVERYKTFLMMRAYCEQAKVFGEQMIPAIAKSKHLTVILNPEANNRKSNAQFEKFAAPLLHLAGYKVSLIQTTQEKEAQKLMEIMSKTDAVIVAGGDGTLHEVVTGLMRRPRSEDETLPLGIIPVGRTNTVAKYLFGSKSSSNAQLMAEAAMAIIQEGTVSLDVMEVKYSNEESPVYAVSSFEQGAFAEVEPKVQKYWYLGSLKDKFTYFINSFKDHNTINYSQVEYVEPCSGCSRCYVPPKLKEGRWWSVFLPRKSDVNAIAIPDHSKVINEECGKQIPVESSSYSNFSVFTSSADEAGKGTDGLWIKMYPKHLSLKQFIASGLKHRESKLDNSGAMSDVFTMINAREVKITNEEKDSESEDSEEYCYIDKEKYKMSSCDITLIPKRVTVYA